MQIHAQREQFTLAQNARIFQEKMKFLTSNFFLEYLEDLTFASKQMSDFKASQKMLTGQKCEKKHKIDCLNQIAAQKWSNRRPKNS